MVTVGELNLFKACLENPRTGLHVSDLCTSSLPNSHNWSSLPQEEVMQRKALKLLHMVWSGITKYVRTVCIINRNPIDFPGIGIFKPESKNKQEVVSIDTS